MNSRNDRILRVLLPRLIDGQAPPRLPDGEEEAVLDSLTAHGLAALTGLRSGKKEWARLFSIQGRERLKSHSRHRAAAYAAALPYFDKLVAAFRDRGLGCIVLKGHAAARAWPAPCIRPSCDIDLLLLPEERIHSREIFEANNYRLVSSAPASEKWINSLFPRALPLDVNTALRAPGCRNPMFRPDYGLFWKSSSRTGQDGFQVPADDHHLVFMAVHAADHAFSRFLWLADIAFALNAMDKSTFSIKELLSLARSWHAERALSLTLHLVSELFFDQCSPDKPLPGNILPPTGCGWFAARLLSAPSTWSDRVISRYTRPLLRCCLVDNPLDLVRAIKI